MIVVASFIVFIVVVGFGVTLTNQIPTDPASELMEANYLYREKVEDLPAIRDRVRYFNMGKRVFLTLLVIMVWVSLYGYCTGKDSLPFSSIGFPCLAAAFCYGRENRNREIQEYLEDKIEPVAGGDATR